MPIISSIKGREILDSRGTPTVEAEVLLADKSLGVASVPSGASVGSKEAVELRDRDMSRFSGKGVLKAVANINQEIADLLQGDNIESFQDVDKKLIEFDGTSTKSRLGANAILAVSLATAKAMAKSTAQPLHLYLQPEKAKSFPVPLMNVINGGAHASNNLDIQEFMIVPAGFKLFSDALRCGVEIYQALKQLLGEQNLQTTVGDEGGYAPNLASNERVFDLLMEAIEIAGYQPNVHVWLALDIASSELYDGKKYYFGSTQQLLSSEQFIDKLEKWISEYPIISLEDAMAEDDFDGWRLLTQRIGNRVQLVGDDLFVTNSKLLREGIKNDLGNAILIKPNQIGTLTETLETVSLAHEMFYNTILSHRSGETEDSMVADIAVAVAAGQIKTGAPCRSERNSKYNQLLRLEELSSDIPYAGVEMIYAKYFNRKSEA